MAMPKQDRPKAPIHPETNDLIKLFSLSQDLMCTASFDGYFICTNPAFEKILGYSQEDFFNTPFINFVHPDDREATIAETAKLASGIPTIHFENRYRCKDGTYKWLTWMVTPSPQERLLYGTAHDITETKQQFIQQTAMLAIGEAIQQMTRPAHLSHIAQICSEHLKQAGLNFQDLVIHRLIDPNDLVFETYEVIDSHAPTCRVLKRPNVYHMWQAGHAIYRPNLTQNMGGLSQQALNGMNQRIGASIQCILDVPHCRGTLALMSTQIHAFSEKNIRFVEQITNLLSVGITRAEDLEQLEMRNKALDQAQKDAEVASIAKSRFLANMSHELRTPLNAIIGYSEMLKEDAQDSEHSDFLSDVERILSSGKHLLGLINDILDISKIEAGKMELYLETFDIESLIHDVAITVAPLIEKNANTLQLNISPDLGQMHADQIKVRQNLLNLLSNAAKFTTQGSIELSVQLKSINNTNHVIFRISDTGIGMAKDQIEHLFQPFAQADISTSRKYGGTGLGLTLCKQFCTMMGGDIAIESTPGKGSTFTFWLPTLISVPSKPLVPANNPLRKNPDFAVSNQTTVLIIDDDPDARLLIKNNLAKAGYRVMGAPDGETGLRMIKEHHPEVVLLDILMPKIDGWTVLTTLKTDPEVAHIPVIISSVVDNQNLGFSLGATDYLIKPIQKDQLFRVMDKYRKKEHIKRILLIDDEADNRDMIFRLLKPEGYQITAAENGRIALATLSREMPDLILLDLMMPEMDGFTFLEHIKQRDIWCNIPVIVLTAKDLTTQDRTRLKNSVTRIFERRTSTNLLGELHKHIQQHMHTKPGPK